MNTPKVETQAYDSVLDYVVDDTQNVQNDQNAVVNETHGSQEQDQLGHKMDLIALTNGWNDKNERIIISIGENAASYKWMHERCASHYKMISRFLSIVMIVFSTGLSAGTVIPTSSDNLAFDIVRRVFTYIITLMSVLQNFLKYEQTSQQHLASAMAHSQLYHDIQQHMCMYRRDRPNATTYVSNTLKQYDSLILKGPDINGRVVQQFKNAFKNTEISVPDIADRIQKIEIISEPAKMQQTTSKNKDLQNDATKRYGRYGVCNLQQVHNAFQIHGDISDHDVQNANAIGLRDLRSKFLQEKSNFEYARYLEHASDFDKI
jgi:hypothetical protein